MSRTDTASLGLGLVWTRDRSVAIDGGAHFGDWTAAMLERFGLVFAFEPFQKCFDHLFTRFGDNHRVVLDQRALLDRVGHGSICDPEDTQKARAKFVVQRDEGETKITTIDSFGFTRCALIKLDIEGGEFPAIQGAAKTILRCGPTLIIETKKVHQRRYGYTMREMNVFLDHKLGYACVGHVGPDAIYVRKGTRL